MYKRSKLRLESIKFIYCIKGNKRSDDINIGNGRLRSEKGEIYSYYQGR